MIISPADMTPDSLLAERYGHPQQWSPPEWNTTLDVLLAHRSVRRWTEKDVSENTVRTILAAAQSGSSSSNQQVVSAVVVRSAETKAALAEVAGPRQAPHLTTAPVVVVWLIDYSRARSIAAGSSAAGGPGADLGALDFLDAALVGATDIGIAGQNAVVAAESLGLGTVFLGSLRSDAARVSEILGLPDGVVPFLGLELGYPDPSEPAGVKPRLPQDLIVHRERYDPALPAHGTSDYDQAMSDYYARFGHDHSWSTTLLGRLAMVAVTSTQRWRLRSVFERAGLMLR